MLIVSVLAAPERADLTEAVIAPLCQALDGGPLRWLAPGIAAEFAIAEAPADIAAHADALRARGFDIAVQPDKERRMKLLLADMDSTMIDQECIDELAAEAGVGARVAAITARAMNGELDFAAALRERVALLAGLSQDVIAHVLATRITIAAGAPDLVATMRAHGAHALLVSGGFRLFTREIARRLNFHEERANELVVHDGHLTGEVATPILGRAAKIDTLHETCARLGLAPADALAVGDGANDLGMIGAAGMGVALHAKPAVAARAPIRIDHGDLTAPLYLQGYRQDEFVRP